MAIRIAVFGTGYLGATHAACMAELGHHVIGVDVDQSKVDRLNAGELPFFEPGLDEVLARNLENGRLRFTTSYAEAAEFAEVSFIGVGTPQRSGGLAADMTYVDAVIETLGPLIERPMVIYGKSTVPVGTAGRLAERLKELVKGDNDVELSWNPEFLREGFAVQDTLRPDRIVVGVNANPDSRAVEVAREVYASILETGTPFLVTDLATAEMVKTAANAFLATKISFINAMAELCEAAGADVTQLADAIGLDDRIGRKFLNAGLGFGGGCLPKDIRAFMARAGELGVDNTLSFLREVDAINMRRRTRMFELTREAVGSFPGTRIAVLGLAFKPNSDDIRDSPALNVAGLLHLHGASVVAYDPKANDNARKAFPTLSYVDDVTTACTGADAVLVLTEWDEFRALEPEVLGATVRVKRILDGRNCLDREKWEKAGWAFRALGRPVRPPV